MLLIEKIKNRARQMIDIGAVLEVKKFLNLYPKVKSSKQFGKSTFYKKRTKEDSKLSIDLPLKKQFNLLRICNNDLWPAFFYFKKKKYIIKIYKE